MDCVHFLKPYKNFKWDYAESRITYIIQHDSPHWWKYHVLRKPAMQYEKKLVWAIGHYWGEPLKTTLHALYFHCLNPTRFNQCHIEWSWLPTTQGIIFRLFLIQSGVPDEKVLLWPVLHCSRPLAIRWAKAQKLFEIMEWRQSQGHAFFLSDSVLWPGCYCGLTIVTKLWV